MLPRKLHESKQFQDENRNDCMLEINETKTVEEQKENMFIPVSGSYQKKNEFIKENDICPDTANCDNEDAMFSDSGIYMKKGDFAENFLEARETKTPDADMSSEVTQDSGFYMKQNDFEDVDASSASESKSPDFTKNNNIIFAESGAYKKRNDFIEAF